MARRIAKGLLLGGALAASAGPAWAGATTKLVSDGMGGVPADGGSGAPVMDRLPRSGGVGSEHHAAARMSTPSMPARASAGVR